MQEITNGLSGDNKELAESAYKNAMNAVTQAMSPFTATTGEKARSILKRCSLVIKLYIGQSD